MCDASAQQPPAGVVSAQPSELALHVRLLAAGPPRSSPRTLFRVVEKAHAWEGRWRPVRWDKLRPPSRCSGLEETPKGRHSPCDVAGVASPAGKPPPERLARALARCPAPSCASQRAGLSCPDANRMCWDPHVRAWPITGFAFLGNRPHQPRSRVCDSGKLALRLRILPLVCLQTGSYINAKAPVPTQPQSGLRCQERGDAKPVPATGNSRWRPRPARRQIRDV